MQLIIRIILIFILSISISSADEIFVSLKKNKVNVRYGPSFDSDVKYVYKKINLPLNCLLYTSPSPRDLSTSRMPSSA